MSNDIGESDVSPTESVAGRGLAKQHPERLTWLSSSLTGVELIVGLWTIRQGARRAIAYHLFALIMSIFGSFVLNALMRM